jgi:hypothetical protein
MNRREKRNAELEMRKLKARTYTYSDVLAAVKTANRKYDIVYTTAAICAVRETFKAGKVRIGTFAKLMFDQIEGLSAKTIEADDMLKMCQDVGVHITQDDEKFSIYIEKGR